MYTIFISELFYSFENLVKFVHGLTIILVELFTFI
jgi:hypothetical protein